MIGLIYSPVNIQCGKLDTDHLDCKVGNTSSNWLIDPVSVPLIHNHRRTDEPKIHNHIDFIGRNWYERDGPFSASYTDLYWSISRLLIASLFFSLGEPPSTHV